LPTLQTEAGGSLSRFSPETFDLHRREYWADSVTRGITQFVLQDYHYEIIGLVNGLIAGKLEVVP